jgi:hypothetical protein
MTVLVVGLVLAVSLAVTPVGLLLADRLCAVAVALGGGGQCTSGDIAAQVFETGTATVFDVAIGLKAPVVGGLGVNASHSTSESTSTGAYSWGRGWEEWSACA